MPGTRYRICRMAIQWIIGRGGLQVLRCTCAIDRNIRIDSRITAKLLIGNTSDDSKRSKIVVSAFTLFSGSRPILTTDQWYTVCTGIVLFPLSLTRFLAVFYILVVSNKRTALILGISERQGKDKCLCNLHLACPACTFDSSLYYAYSQVLVKSLSSF